MEIVDTYFPSGVSTSTLQTQQVHILLSFTLLLTLFTYRFHIMANFRCTPEVHQEESARGTSDYNKFPPSSRVGLRGGVCNVNYHYDSGLEDGRTRL